MRKRRSVLLLAAIVSSSVMVLNQPAIARQAGTDPQGKKSFTMPNDLADGNILLKSRPAKQVITVGGPQADISGFTSAAIQIAVDAMRMRGGGTVELKPGTYAISAPVQLASNMTLTGAGDATILRKIDGYHSLVDVDADYGMMKVTVKDASGFKIGMGVELSDSRWPSDWDVTVATIINIEGNTVFLDQPTLRDYDCEHKAVLTNACSIVEAVGVQNVHITNLTVDGNKETNDLLGGCRGGAVYLQRAVGCLVENVKAKNFNGDVINWQITKDITVRNCESSYSAGKGFHPGTGSENSLIEGCSSHHNLDGIFLCWRVKKGTLRNNKLYSNERDGLSVNKKDTDNNVIGNHIYDNGRNGVWFSDYGVDDNSHRIVFTDNVIENNGTKVKGFGMSINSNMRDITLRNNTIRDTGKKTQKSAVVIGKGALNIQVDGNTMSGHPDGDIVRQ